MPDDAPPHLPAAAVRLILATSPQLLRAGERLPLPSRDAALLAFLALEGPTPRARLAALLWPDHPGDAARNVLRQRLFALRKRAGMDLVDGQQTLRLAAGISHDLELADAVLAGVAPAWGDEFQDWLDGQGERRRRQRREALAATAEAAEAARDWSAALAAAEALLALEPLAEVAHQRLIRLHYLAGDRAAALLAFDRCEQLLKDEVGTAPDATTLALLETVQSSGADVALRGRVPASVLRPPRRVGRDLEWQSLHDAWQSGRVAALAGEGGLGKSRLLEDFADAHGRHAGRVLVVGARPGDALLPYALLSRLLRAVLARPGPPLAAGLRGELARVLPELGDAAPGGGDTTRFANAVEAVLALAVERGLDGLVVDDLHLADDASVERVLASSTRAAPHWLLAWRPAELRPAVRARIDAFGEQHAVDEIALRPLDVDEVAELLAGLRLPGWEGAGHAAALHRRVGGNPMYLLETLRASVAAPPPPDSGATRGVLPAPGINRVILRRIEALSPSAVKLARCAAITGQDFSARLAAQVLQVPALDLADAWNELEAADVLRDGAFAHDLIHEAALASVPKAIARELHDQVARSLEAASGEPARIAFHWQAAGQGPKAAPHLHAAGRIGAARFRYVEAVDDLEAAARLFEQSGQRSLAFDAWFDAADALGALDDDARLADYPDRLDRLAVSDRERAFAAVIRSVVAFDAVRYDEALAVALPGAEAARRAGDAEVESELLYLAGVVHWERREVAAALSYVERALALRRGLDPAKARIEYTATLVTMTQAYGSMLGATGRFDEAERIVLDAVRVAESAGQPLLCVGSAAELTMRRLEAGDAAGALHWNERALAASRSPEANIGDRARFDLNRLNTLMQVGRWGDALALSEELLGRLPSLGTRACDAALRSAQFQLALGRRDLALRTLHGVAASTRCMPAHDLAWSITALQLGEPGDPAALLERAVALEDIAMRARLVARLAPFVDPRAVVPVLGLVATTIRDGGGSGLWLTLQAALAARLAAAGRVADAHAAARLGWQRLHDGTTPSQFLPEVAADLAVALAPVAPALAERAVRLGRDRLREAVATLPLAWSDNAASRSPLRERLETAARLALSGAPD